MSEIPERVEREAAELYADVPQRYITSAAEATPCWCIALRTNPRDPIDPVATIRCDDCGSTLR